MALSDVLRLHARTRPEKDAILAGERRIDYRALDRLVNGLAFALHDVGVRRGNFVGIGLGDSVEHVIALMAISRLGAVIIPLDHRWSEAETLGVATQFQAGRILVDDAPGTASDRWLRLPAFAETDAVYRDDEVTADSGLLFSLSSGTTGLPKGPLATHRQFESRFMPYWMNLGFNAYDRFVSATPLYFGAGRGFTWSMLYAGATVALFPPPYAPEELIEYVARVRGTAIFLVPTILRRLLELEHAGLAFPTVQKLVASGSALYGEERAAIKRRLTPNLYEMYSSTEGGGVSVLGPDDGDLHPDSVGRPCFRVEVEIVDNDHNPLPYGETGRLRYRSPASARSYHAGDSSEAFRDGWYYPGDLAAVSPDGFIFLKGRQKDMIIRGGVNIFPGDIEQVLLGSGCVSEVAVVGMPSRELGEEVGAFVVAARRTDEAELIAVCRAALAPYKVPRRIFLIDSLPKHSGGKVVKSELLRLLDRQVDR